MFSEIVIPTSNVTSAFQVQLKVYDFALKNRMLKVFLFWQTLQSPFSGLMFSGVVETFK
jgi:hypothetical protein